MKTSSPAKLHAVFLGTADGSTSVDREHSGVLLQSGSSTLLLDCGGNVARYLRAREYSADQPGAIWLSHMHSDHIGQFSMLIQSLWLRQRKAPLRVFGPPQVLEVMRDFLVKCILFPTLIGFPIEWDAVQPGVPMESGPFTLTAFATDHLLSLAQQFRADHPSTCYECYGVALDIDARRYVYSADLAHPSEMAPALKDREVEGVISELTHFPERELFAELAQHRVKAVWLTHFPDSLAGREKQLKIAAQDEHFTGRVHLLHDKVAEAI